MLAFKFDDEGFPGREFIERKTSTVRLHLGRTNTYRCCGDDMREEIVGVWSNLDGTGQWKGGTSQQNYVRLRVCALRSSSIFVHLQLAAATIHDCYDHRSSSIINISSSTSHSWDNCPSHSRTLSNSSG